MQVELFVDWIDVNKQRQRLEKQDLDSNNLYSWAFGSC